jgi:hypothetical protein
VWPTYRKNEKVWNAVIKQQISAGYEIKLDRLGYQSGLDQWRFATAAIGNNSHKAVFSSFLTSPLISAVRPTSRAASASVIARGPTKGSSGMTTGPRRVALFSY